MLTYVKNMLFGLVLVAYMAFLAGGMFAWLIGYLVFDALGLSPGLGFAIGACYTLFIQVPLLVWLGSSTSEPSEVTT